MFFSYQINADGILTSFGVHYQSPPESANVSNGAILSIKDSHQPNIKTGMKYNSTDGGFYNLDADGNEIAESFVAFDL